MLINVYTDPHLGASNAIAIDLNFLERPKMRTILLGDVFDLAKCWKKELPLWRGRYEHAKLLFGEDYVEGNHEKDGIRNRFRVVESENGTRAIFCHGDLEANFMRWKEYREKNDAGCGLIGRTISRFIEINETIIDRKPSEDFIQAAIKIAKENNCTEYYCGHFHPKERIIVVRDGVKITILPRGKNLVEII